MLRSGSTGRPSPATTCWCATCSAHLGLRGLDRAARCRRPGWTCPTPGAPGRPAARGGSRELRPATTCSASSHLLDAIVRGATGSPLADRFRTLVAEPLGADFHLGVPDDALDRCAGPRPAPRRAPSTSRRCRGQLLRADPGQPLPSTSAAYWQHRPVAPGPGRGRQRARQRPLDRPHPVRGVARWRGRRRTSALGDAFSRVFEVQADGTDLALLVPLRWGIGCCSPPSAPAVPDGRVCWWTGYGGAIVVNDLDRRTTVAYAMNRMVPHFTSSPRTDGYLRTAFACLDRFG